VWHGRDNTWINFSAFDENKLVLDLNAETLSFYFQYIQAVFAPPSGKSFRNFPFSETLEVVRVYDFQKKCTTSSFAGVHAVIDDSVAAYVPFACPSTNIIGSYDTCACVDGVDTIGTGSSTTVGNVRTDRRIVPTYSCAPCEGSRHSTDTTVTVYKTPCVADEKNTCVESVTTTNSAPELSVNVQFQGPDINGYSLSPLSGSYSLKWTANAYIGTAGAFALFFNNWELLDQQDGVGRPSNLKGVMWSGEGQNAEQGWRVDYRTAASVPYGNCLGMTLVVAPVNATFDIDLAGRSVTPSQCGADEIAYQVKMAVFRGVNINSDYGHWNWELSAYANVSCRQRVCGEKPSVSLNSTQNVYVPTSGLWYQTAGRLGSVTVSVS
jgi:hypothetical protein